MKASRFLFLLLIALGLVLGAACKRRQAAAPIDKDINMVVASFTQPFTLGQILTGYVPVNSQKAPMGELKWLDSFLADKLGGRYPAAPRNCLDVNGPPEGADKGAALEYWVNVGRCAGADFVLVPQVLYWKEREGGPMASVSPAGVVIDMYVVDVKEFGIVARSHYDETQISLSENVLTLDKFLKRGGKWVEARRLAEEGVLYGLRKLGL